MNNLNFTGNLGSDAEVRYTADQKPITSWSVALRSGFGKSEKTSWVRCTLFGDRGVKLAEYLKKGTQVAVSGELSLNEYTNKQGENKASLECNVNNLTLIGKRDTLSEPKEPAKANAYQNQPLDEIESDIPF
jgi:single-strand DNA-binding protein